MFQVNALLRFTLTLLGTSFLANLSLANPAPKAHLGNLNPQVLPERRNRNQISRGSLNGILAPETGPHPAPITPRADPFNVLPIAALQPGWELDFYDYDWGYLPVASASTMLQLFYRKIFELAVSAAPGPILDHAMLSLGQLDLEIISSSGAVSWESVAAFAAHMMRAAQRGYTNSYHCHMSNVAAGAAISFNLYVRKLRQVPPKAR